MILNSDLECIDSHPVARGLATPLLAAAATVESPDAFLQLALPRIRDAAECEHVSVMRAELGRWQTLASDGSALAASESFLAEVLDDESTRTAGPWSAAPLRARRPRNELLVVRCEKCPTEELISLVEALAALLAITLAATQQNFRATCRVERLEAILEIAGQWNKTRNVDELLQQMAEAATELFDAERASIFLWDRRNKNLVARPALGVDDGELTIPDDQGIVGQVIHSGEARRVEMESDADQQEVNREVDRQLKYHTRSLLCVPLRGAKGQLRGAFELINKRQANFTAEDQAGLVELAAHAAIALENSQEHQQLLQSRRQIVDQVARDVQLIGNSPAVEQLRSKIERVANTELAVLLLGENGTGKEVASRLLHYLSKRRDEPFVAVNCAALTESLLESELFGHERGAFTDAHEARAGKFELASGGTLFLDEIGDLSPGGQAKLLRVLEEKIVVRVGGSVPISTDARVIAATNQNLAELVREGRFREDLFFRLNVVSLEIPPLRERGDDILQLADHFLQIFCSQAGRQLPTLTAAARKSLLRYPWPGNIRELRNLMERVAYLTQGDTLDTDELVFVLSPDQVPATIALDQPLAEATRQFQVDYIRSHIDSSQGNMTDAARRLGLHRSNLYRKMRQLEMVRDAELSDSDVDVEQ